MNLYDIWLVKIKLNNKLKINLLNKFKASKAIYEYCNNNLYISKDIESERKVKLLMKNQWNKDELNKYLNILEDKEINIALFNEEKYPIKLKECSNAPIALFYKGDIVSLNHHRSVAIVGSRRCSYYGENLSEIISRELCQKEVSIISGMAKGIDSFAHFGALKNDGFTCAVLGCGVDIIYPKQNKELYKEIIKKGCIVSEFLPGTEPLSYNFPLRNRIISGLSEAVVVVEASERSGSLITATYALDQGRDVFSVPGSILSETSKGTNKLIKEGAFPLTSVEDICNFLNIEYNSNKKDKIRLDKKDIIKLDKIENKVFSIINETPMYIDDILKYSNIDIKQLYEVLFELQLKNRITCLSGNYYVKIANSI